MARSRIELFAVVWETIGYRLVVLVLRVLLQTEGA